MNRYIIQIDYKNEPRYYKCKSKNLKKPILLSKYKNNSKVFNGEQSVKDKCEHLKSLGYNELKIIEYIKPKPKYRDDRADYCNEFDKEADR